MTVTTLSLKNSSICLHRVLDVYLKSDIVKTVNQALISRDGFVIRM